MGQSKKPCSELSSRKCRAADNCQTSDSGKCVDFASCRKYNRDTSQCEASDKCDYNSTDMLCKPPVQCHLVKQSQQLNTPRDRKLCTQWSNCGVDYGSMRCKNKASIKEKHAKPPPALSWYGGGKNARAGDITISLSGGPNRTKFSSDGETMTQAKVQSMLGSWPGVTVNAGRKDNDYIVIPDDASDASASKRKLSPNATVISLSKFMRKMGSSSRRKTKSPSRRNSAVDDLQSQIESLTIDKRSIDQRLRSLRGKLKTARKNAN